MEIATRMSKQLAVILGRKNGSTIGSVIGLMGSDKKVWLLVSDVYRVRAHAKVAIHFYLNLRIGFLENVRWLLERMSSQFCIYFLWIGIIWVLVRNYTAEAQSSRASQ